MSEQSALTWQDDDAGGMWRAVHADACGNVRVRWFSNWHRAARWLNEQRMRDRIDAAGIHDGDDWNPQF